MRWQDQLGKQGSKPEMQLRKILDEMGLNYISNEYVDTPFKIHRIEADFLVEKCLVIEVQSEYFHSKKRRRRKDLAKRACFTALGYGFLELWDDELRYANQVKRGPMWKPYIKDMITKSLSNARRLFRFYESIKNIAGEEIRVEHPELGEVYLHKRRE